MKTEDLNFAFQAFDKNFGLEGEGLAILEKLPFTKMSYAAKQAVHHAGDKVDYIYIVLDGWLTTVLNRMDGQRLLLDFHIPVDLMGLEFLADRRAASSLIAFEDTKVLRMPIDPFTHALAQNDSASIAVLRTLAGSYTALQQQMAVFAFADAPAKIASLLLGLQSKQTRNAVDDPNILQLPLTQYDIADALGLSNVTVSRVFTKFSEAGLVTFKRGAIALHDPVRLRQSARLTEY